MPFWAVINCPNLAAAQLGIGPCASVAVAQGNLHPPHLPEPWSGHLDTARLLFVSSNPGFDPLEYFPDNTWPAARTEEFFTDRFVAGQPPYVQNRRVRYAIGGYAAKAPQYWSEVQAGSSSSTGRRCGLKCSASSVSSRRFPRAESWYWDRSKLLDGTASCCSCPSQDRRGRGAQVASCRPQR